MFLTRAEDETSLRQFLDFNESTWSVIEVQLAMPWLCAHIEHQRYGTNEGRTLAFTSPVDLCELLKQPGTRLLSLQVMTPPGLEAPCWQLNQVREVKATSVDGLYLYCLIDGQIVQSLPIDPPTEGMTVRTLLKPLH